MTLSEANVIREQAEYFQVRVEVVLGSMGRYVRIYTKNEQYLGETRTVREAWDMMHAHYDSLGYHGKGLKEDE